MRAVLIVMADLLILLAALPAVREEPGDTRENRDRCYSAHREDIDPVRYREHLASVGGA